MRDLGDVLAAVTEMYDPVLRAHARSMVKSPVFPSGLTPQKEAAVLAWIDSAPLDDVARAFFGGDDE